MKIYYPQMLNILNCEVSWKGRELIEDKNAHDSEQRVEKVINVAKYIIDEAIKHLKPSLLVAGFSGGNDSIVTTHFLSEFYKEHNPPPEVFYANTGIGIEKTRQHIINICDKFNWVLQEYKAQPEGPPKFHYVGNIRVPAQDYYKQYGIKTKLPLGKWIDGATAYEEEIFNYGFPGAPQHFKMFTVLKRRPLEKYIKTAKREHGFKRNSTILFVTGIRRDESSIRAGYNAVLRKNKSIIWCNPFYYANKYDFELYRQEFGLPRNSITDILGYSGECLCGSYAKPGEVELLKLVDIEKYNYIKKLENKIEQLDHCRYIWGRSTRIRGNDLEKLDSDLEKPFMPMCVGCERRR